VPFVARIFVFAVFVSLLTSCGNLYIRVANRSNTTIESVRVAFPSQTEDYGTIQAHSATDFRKICQAYRYAYIEAVVDGQVAVLRPRDYVGEKPLSGGKYTYALTVIETAESKHDRLRLELVRK